MSDELDLETGDSSAAEDILARGQEARARRGASKSTRSSKSTRGAATKAATEAEDKSLREKCVQCFNDFYEQFAERDPELADVLNRRKDAMAQGLVGLTRSIKVLRGPLVLLINFLQPTMAFWELGSLLFGRWVARRSRIAYQQRNEANGTTDVTDVTGNKAAHGYA